MHNEIKVSLTKTLTRKQYISHIDLFTVTGEWLKPLRFILFPVFHPSCFLSLLLVAAVVWKIKQTCWASRRREVSPQKNQTSLRSISLLQFFGNLEKLEENVILLKSEKAQRSTICPALSWSVNNKRREANSDKLNSEYMKNLNLKSSSQSELLQTTAVPSD